MPTDEPARQGFRWHVCCCSTFPTTTYPQPSSLQALTAARHFAAAFQSALDTNPAIRTAATVPLSTGLQEGYAAADERLGTVLSPEHGTLAFIGASGYRQWIAGPEAAVRRLVADALELYKAPTQAAAAGIQAALQAAANEAAASLPADLPDHLHEQLASLAAGSISGWAAGAVGQLHLLLQAEQACPDNDSFAELQRQLSLMLSTPPAEEEEPGEWLVGVESSARRESSCAAL